MTSDGSREKPIVTAGDGVATLGDAIPPLKDGYSATEVCALE